MILPDTNTGPTDSFSDDISINQETTSEENPALLNPPISDESVSNTNSDRRYSENFSLADIVSQAWDSVHSSLESGKNNLTLLASKGMDGLEWLARKKSEFDLEMMRQKRMSEFFAFAVRDIPTDDTRATLSGNNDLTVKAAAWTDDRHDKMMMGWQLLSAIAGEDTAFEPALYWRMTGEKLPDFKTKDEAYIAIWDDWSSRARQNQLKRIEKLKQLQAEQKLIETKVSSFINDSPDFQDTDMLLLTKNYANPEESVESLKRAREALRYLKRVHEVQGDAVFRTRAGGLEVMKRLAKRETPEGILELDEIAIDTFIDAAEILMKNSQDSDLHFIRNFGIGFSSTFLSAADGLTKITGYDRVLEQIGYIPQYGVMHLPNENDEKVRRDARLIRLNEDNTRKFASRLSVLTKIGREYLDDGSRFSSLIGGINMAGTTLGETVPSLHPAGMISIGIPSAMNDSYNAAILNNAEHPFVEASIDTFWNKGAELLPTGKLLKAIPGTNRMLGSFWGRFSLNTADNIVSETITEPLIDSYGNTLTRKVLIASGVDIKDKKWDGFDRVWNNFSDPKQIISTVIVAHAQSSFHSKTHLRQAREFTKNINNCLLLGIKPEHAREISGIENDSKRIEKMQEYFESDTMQDMKGAISRAEQAGRIFISEEEAGIHVLTGAAREIWNQKGIMDVTRIPGSDNYRVTYQEGLNNTQLRQSGNAGSKTIELDGHQLNTWARYTLDEKDRRQLEDFSTKVFANAVIRANRDNTHISFLDSSEISAIARDLHTAREEGKALTIHLSTLDTIIRQARETINDLERTGKKTAYPADESTIIPGSPDQKIASMENPLKVKGQDSNSAVKLPAFDPARCIIAYVRGEVSAQNLYEQITAHHISAWIERVPVEQQAREIEHFGQQLRMAQTLIRQSGHDISFIKEEGQMTKKEIIESFTILAQSHALTQYDKWNLPQWAQSMFHFTTRNMSQTQDMLKMGDAWKIVINSPSGEKLKSDDLALLSILNQTGTEFARMIAKTEVSNIDTQTVRKSRDLNGPPGPGLPSGPGLPDATNLENSSIRSLENHPETPRQRTDTSNADTKQKQKDNAMIQPGLKSGNSLKSQSSGKIKSINTNRQNRGKPLPQRKKKKSKNNTTSKNKK